MLYNFIPKKACLNLRNYSYKGVTNSLSYEFIWSPLCNFLNKFTPEYIAPNLISFMGYLCCVGAHCLVMAQTDNLSIKDSAPSWPFFLAALLVLLYQIFDNLDGKQARKTSSSSALGMLFDHGTDSMVTWLVGWVPVAILVDRPSFITYFSLVPLVGPGFYLSQWC